MPLSSVPSRLGRRHGRRMTLEIVTRVYDPDLEEVVETVVESLSVRGRISQRQEVDDVSGRPVVDDRVTVVIARDEIPGAVPEVGENRRDRVVMDGEPREVLKVVASGASGRAAWELEVRR